MDDIEFALEFNEADDFEEKYADELDALNQLEEEERLNEEREAELGSDGPYCRYDHPLETINSDKPAREFIDIWMESFEPPKRKRQKIEDEFDSWQQSSKEKKLPEKPPQKKEERKHGCQIPQLGKEYITVTNTEGRRVYFLIKKDDDEDKIEAPKMKTTSLLSTPIEELLKKIEDKKFTEAENRKKDAERKGNSEVKSEFIFKSKNAYALWVEKFRPRVFTELLSDDGINRTLLKWIKLWDLFVFGKMRKSKKQKKREKMYENELKFGKRKRHWEYEEEMDLDNTGRPTYKIALLAGSPGLGKTTLAHIVAKHAGYNPVEMNASDDRSAELFKNKLETTTQMKACMGKGKKPNCLIIDEIDGAPTQAINILLQAIKDTISISDSKKKKKKPLTITRPIICICNDLYVPALRQLRQCALTLSVPQVAPSRLAQRLQKISAKENMRTDIGCLLALCQKAENDIRSCVNTLQFASEKYGELSANNLQDISIGQKDLHKGVFEVLKSTFQLRRLNRSYVPLREQLPFKGINNQVLALSGISTDPCSSTAHSNDSIRFHNILHMASSNSEYEKLTQGLFDNYLNLKSKDPHFDKIVQCTSWLQFADEIETKIRSEQNYSLMKYYPFVPVAFHMHLAGPFTPKLSYNNSAIEFNTRMTRMKNIWETVIHDVKPNVKRNVGNIAAILDIFPFVYETIHPTLRPVNTQLYSPSEKQQLLNLISTMISYNLNYHQERNSDGQYTYMLQPNIGELISFPNLPQHKQLSYGAKQLIQREIELEKMRKIEMSVHEMEMEKEGKSKQKIINQTTATEKLRPIALKQTQSKPVLDFFGREIKQAKGTEKTEEGESSVINTNVWYKFNEGYTNAVRRTVRVKDFL